jgi:hypothetical protein
VHVPVNAEEDTTVALKKIDERTYSLAPYPFGPDRLTITCHGRYVAPFRADFPPDRVGGALRELPEDLQEYVLVPG